MLARVAQPAVIVVLAAALGAMVAAAALRAGGAPAASAQAAERTIYMAAVEPKGSASVEREPFPTAELPPGGGYVLRAPNPEGTWEVETYRWDPGTVVVSQGDQVTLEIFGVNGRQHDTTVEGHVPQFTVQRGQLTRVTFTANQVGIFNIVCRTHTPTMTAQLVVLPRTSM